MVKDEGFLAFDEETKISFIKCVTENQFLELRSVCKKVNDITF